MYLALYFYLAVSLLVVEFLVFAYTAAKNIPIGEQAVSVIGRILNIWLIGLLLAGLILGSTPVWAVLVLVSTALIGWLCLKHGSKKELPTLSLSGALIIFAFQIVTIAFIPS